MDSFLSIYKSLKPKERFEDYYVAKTSKNLAQDIWFSRNEEGYPCIFIKTKKNNSFSNLEYTYIKLVHQVEQKIEIKGESYKSFCSQIICKSDDDGLIELFFDCLKPSLERLLVPCDPNEINHLLKRMIQLFNNLDREKNKDVQGLWSELFLINNSSNPKEMVACWHDESNEKYDFSKDRNFLEVKSSKGNKREHVFSLEQAHGKAENTVLIASLKLDEDDEGYSLKSLLDQVLEKVKGDSELVEKVQYNVRSTLGKNWKSGLNVSFDHDYAKSELNFYDLKDIPKLDKACRVEGVSNIKFSSDLGAKSPIAKSRFKNKSKLFQAAFGL
ncbi:PD-(D/E)XK motif protein [Gammaproteobacteria bacterium]|nr:PD-(D/E)XK motif protein [Gammaproteobacteria bacterium]